MPDSRTVGMSGAEGERSALSSAIGRSRPCLKNGTAGGSVATTMPMCPATASVTAGPQPLCGTCSASIAIACLSISMPK